MCCGSGHSLKYNADRGAGELWGVDLSQKQLDNAAKLLEESGYSVHLICARIEDDLDVPKEYFDYVIMGDVLEHLMDPEIVLKRLQKYLKQGGGILLSVCQI